MASSNVTVSPNTTEDKEDIADQAMKALALFFKPGLGSKGNIQVYDDASKKYDLFVKEFEYSAPKHAAKAIGEIYQHHRESIAILDVAAGTGLVAIEMYNMGFRNMDALDPSQGMLAVAASKGLYRKLYNNYINDNVPIDDDTYDCIVIAGGMGENQIPCAGLYEMIRLVKPGGYIINSTRLEHLTHCSEYRGRLDKLMQELESEGRWKQVSRTSFPNIVRGKEGLLLVHQVL